ncbi:MAG: hypothetical protein JWP68_2275 [Modestobacter sp.]|nr:hypothetical protein [Modestobacter sp.]
MRQRDHRRVAKRYTEQVATNDHTCGICGRRGLVVTRSRARRRGADWLNPRFDPGARTYEKCPDCGVRYRIEDGHRV